MKKLTKPQLRLLHDITILEDIYSLYGYVNKRGDMCFGFKSSQRSDLYTTLKCRPLFNAGIIEKVEHDQTTFNFVVGVEVADRYRLNAKYRHLIE